MSLPHPAPVYRPGLAWFATLGSLWVFLLVTLGAFTTSIGAGMAFEDWPLSNGSINPDGWLSDVMMFAEHSHRLTGATMGLITIGLAVALQRSEPRPWVRRLGWLALAIVIIQGLLGGFRVTLDAVDLPWLEMSLGQVLRIPHGILAQVFVCVLFALAASVSRRWVEGRGAVEAPRELRWMGRGCTLLVFAQLWVATVMRHNHAGMAIPHFPLSTESSLLPAAWNYQVVLAFAHRVLAFVILAVLGHWLRCVLQAKVVPAFEKRLALSLAAALLLQIALGASIIWTGRNPYVTTAHVVVGALVLALTFLLTWWLHYAPLTARAHPEAPSHAPRRA